jgi:predicted dehydrogenase
MTDARRLRYAIVGTGMMGIEHIQAISSLPNTEIVALCDPHQASIVNAQRVLESNDSLVKSGDSNEAVRSFSDVDDLVAYGNFDVAIVSSPNHTHRAVVAPLLRHGCHILIEKPLCVDVQQCRQVIELEAESRTSFSERVVWVGLEYRYMAPTMRLLEHVKSGTLGRLRMVAIREHRFPFLVKVNNWNRFSENTGGTLVEKCCHFFDLMRQITGSEPVRVFASGAQDVNHLDERYEGRMPDILDNAFVVVDFLDGSRAALDLCMFAEATKNEQEISVVGDLGKAEALVTESRVRVGLRKNGWFQTDEEDAHAYDVPSSVMAHGSHHGSSWREHVAMQRCIRSGQPAEVTLRDGLMSVAMGEAAHRSIAQGRPVMMSELAI